MTVMEEEKKLSRPGHLNLIPLGEPYTLTSEHLPKDHLSFRIESFTQLSDIVSKSGVETYETASFKKYGYRWKVLMYPNGDVKNAGKGYLSLYLVLEDSVSFPVGLKVFADFSFFLFDQTQNKYAVYKTSEHRNKFDYLKNGNGFSQLISLATFKNASFGYLIDDSCVLGVGVTLWEVVHDKIEAKLGHLSNSGGSVIRTSFKFSQLENEYYETEAFAAGGQNWVLRLYPGWINGYGNHLSMFLRLSGPKSLFSQVMGLFRGSSKHRKVHVKFTLRVIDQLHGKHVERTVCGVYSDLNSSWGCSDFMDLCQLRDKSHGYIQNNKMIVEVEFSTILRTN